MSSDRPRPVRRTFDPSGVSRVVRVGVPRARLGDLYHQFIRSRWRTLVGVIVAVYVGTNAVFALTYLALGDVITNARPGSFADAFFFSVQTLATVGYGGMTPRTFGANVVVTIEALTGLVLTAMCTGLMFAKFARPTARVLFSRVAVVAPRDGVPSLMFRMANERSNQILEAQVRVVLFRRETTLEGERVGRFYDLPLARAQTAVFALTWTAIHPITPESPLYGTTRETLRAVAGEIVVSFVGLDETLAQSVHARHSFVADEVIFDARFVDVLGQSADGQAQIDYTRFHDVEPLEPAGPRALTRTS